MRGTFIKVKEFPIIMRKIVYIGEEIYFPNEATLNILSLEEALKYLEEGHKDEIYIVNPFLAAGMNLPEEIERALEKAVKEVGEPFASARVLLQIMKETQHNNIDNIVIIDWDMRTPLYGEFKEAVNAMGYNKFYVPSGKSIEDILGGKFPKNCKRYGL